MDTKYSASAIHPVSYGTIDGRQIKGEKSQTFASLIGDIDGELERLFKLSQHLSEIGGRMFGTRPTECANDSPETPPVSLLDSLSRRHNTLRRLLNDCEESAQRIAGVL
jgi:hypothetical protein